MSGTSGKKLRVLVVEDEALVAMLIEDMLTALGYEIAAIVGRVGQARESARDLNIDFALIDLNLNGARTDDIAAILSERGIPFVFATGYGAAGVVDAWRSAPVLQKPFRIEDLARAIARALKR